MGYKKIQEKRAELSKKIDVWETFLQAAREINRGLAEIEQATQKLTATKDKLGKTIAVLNTLGVKEFDDFKKSLLAVCVASGTRPLPLKPVEQVVNDARAGLDKELDAWTEKLAAAFPSEIKVGMTFKDRKLGRIYEVVGDRELATNANLTGDDAIWYKCKMFEGEKQLGTQSLSRSRLSPKHGVKFIKA